MSSQLYYILYYIIHIIKENNLLKTVTERALFNIPNTIPQNMIYYNTKTVNIHSWYDSNITDNEDILVMDMTHVIIIRDNNLLNTVIVQEG